MYVPQFFKPEDKKLVTHIVNEYPFAVVTSTDEKGEAYFNHLPVIMKQEGESFRLFGHFAKRNPQWAHFQKNPKSKIIISGPNAYITPTWYKSGRDVPTWNYAAVHLQTTVRLIENFDGLIEILKLTTERFESREKNPWLFELPEDLTDPEALTAAIVGVEFQIENIEAKFKLSQNRQIMDRTGVIEGLSSRCDDMSREVLKLMNT